VTVESDNGENDPNRDWEIVAHGARERAWLFHIALGVMVGITLLLCFWHGPTDLRLRTWGTVLQLIGICVVVFDLKDRLRLYRMRFMPKPTKAELAEMNAKPPAERSKALLTSFVMEYGNTMAKFQAFLGTGWERTLFGVYALVVGVIVATFAPEIVKLETGHWREILSAF
jgi:hypothetical protein